MAEDNSMTITEQQVRRDQGRGGKEQLCRSCLKHGMMMETL